MSGFDFNNPGVIAAAAVVAATVVFMLVRKRTAPVFLADPTQRQAVKLIRKVP